MDDNTDKQSQLNDEEAQPSDQRQIADPSGSSDNGMTQFLDALANCKSDGSLLDFCRKYSLHGTPKIFKDSEESYYEFRKRISEKFEINFHEIFITGSAKLGFSPHQRKLFSYDSDVDVAIVSTRLYDRFMDFIHDYQMELRENRKAVTYKELSNYHRFLEYSAIGWMRPDLLPLSFQMAHLKQDWFGFFKSLSHGKPEVGNYKVSAGVFKSYLHLEKYTMSGLRSLRTALQVGRDHANSD